MVSYNARTSTLPAGSLPPVANLKTGTLKFEFVKVVSDGGDGKYVHVQYPDGFVKEHQVLKIEDLIPKIVNTLRGRYGVEVVITKKIPAVIAQGESITMEI